MNIYINKSKETNYKFTKIKIKSTFTKPFFIPRVNGKKKSQTCFVNTVLQQTAIREIFSQFLSMLIRLCKAETRDILEMQIWANNVTTLEENNRFLGFTTATMT